MESSRIPRITPDEYLTLERAAEHRSEYWFGRITPRAPSSRTHAKINVNFLRAIGKRIEDTPSEIYGINLRLTNPERSVYVYPDLMVTIDKGMTEDRYKDTLLNPVVIAEIYDEDTFLSDCRDKFEFYRTIPTVQEYYLVAQNRLDVRRFVKVKTDVWKLTFFDSLQQTIAIESLNISIPMSEIYDSIPFPDLDENGAPLPKDDRL